ncbi:MAG: hypothetical protein HYS17_01725 [Micavibrio aeruginosavorus]|uniref:Uncharacterized protein n=1 Tax=Micavibrio aeruginosavorus TaxID=349221 RepID=A0A7T5UHK7_9BACT|nr:MAG: hypothetical protein HYS17_01725 [Micavibrio aeruginosavorus]
MIPDLLKAFQGLDQPARRQKLQDEGYIRLPDSSGLCSVYHQPDKKTVLRFSMRPEMAELTSRYFMQNPDNPYLPRVYAHGPLSGGKYICVMEKLTSLQELDEEEGIDLVGQARAIATFPFGDSIHRAAHRGLAQEDKFLEAMLVLANCAKESFRNPSSRNECLFPDRSVSGVMYRRGKNGLPTPVLVDTLTYTAPSRELESQLEGIFTRLHRFELLERRRTLAGYRKGSCEPA